MKTVVRWVVGLALVYGVLSSGDVRRKAISTAAAVATSAAGVVASSLARESARYDAERLDAVGRAGELKASLGLATSDAEKQGLGRELADTEAEAVAIAADLGNVVRSGRIIETAGDAVASSFASKRGYAYATRAGLREAVTAERIRAQALMAELGEARTFLAEATAAGADSDKLARAVSLIEEVNAKLSVLRAGGQ